MQYERLILRHHADRVYAGANAVCKRKVNYPVFAAKRDSRLRYFLSQRSKTRPPAPGEQHGNAFLSG
jgi:hypothetical protein